MTPYFIRFLAVSFMAAIMLLTYHLSHAQGRGTPQVMIVVGYKDGAPVAAQAIGFAPSVDDCQHGLQAELADVDPKSGMILVAVCTPLPPPPPKD